MANKKIVAKKKEQVEQLADKIKDASLVLLVDYCGINVEDDTKLRKQIREANAEYMVIKNNIIARAFEKCGHKGLEEHLVGPTAIIISNEDYLAPSKAIYKFSEENDFYQIKVGLIDGNVKTKEEMIVLAQLPSREELLSKLAGVLLANISKLAVALEEVKKKKESETSEVEKQEEKKEEAKEETVETKEEKVEEEVKEENKEVKE